MTQNQQIQYLANVYYIARADENFQVEEDYLLQDIAKGIGAGYLETRKALDLSQTPDFKIKFPDSLVRPCKKSRGYAACRLLRQKIASYGKRNYCKLRKTPRHNQKTVRNHPAGNKEKIARSD